MRVGETTRLVANSQQASAVIFFSTDPKIATVTPSGIVTAQHSGTGVLIALIPAKPQKDASLQMVTDSGFRVEIPITVKPSPLSRLEMSGIPTTMKPGQSVYLHVKAIDIDGESKDVRPFLEVSDSSIAQVNKFGPLFEGTFSAHPYYDRDRPDIYPNDASGILRAVSPGKTVLRARMEDIVAEHEIIVETNHIDEMRSFSLMPIVTEVRTGDVVKFQVQPENALVRFALESHPDPSRADTVGAGAPAHILPDGRFVAEQPGLYTILATNGKTIAQQTINIVPRNVKQDIEFVGHAPVRDRVTSDLWVWEGLDGRDYAILGTWNADGHALFFDVTDPKNMQRISEIQVDARTVNDVKVSKDSRIAVISREGASNRRNGFVVLDVSDPRNPKVLSRYDDQLTGGVHNVFLYENHVYAINNGSRWDVINIEDPENPFRVARFEDQRPGRSVHDVWVRDGIAFQAGNTDGIILIDVGGGNQGGSPANPIEIGRLPQLTGWNHAVWPFQSKSAGKFYIIAGDEAHPVNPRIPGPIISWEEKAASRAMGWIHILDFEDTKAPKEIARYHVTEAGPHNLWIDWDKEIMYVAYFNGGLRVVDISGELVGDLYRQGREIAKFYSDDPEGFVPNSPFVWGPQPHKGTIFFSDFHSGLWAVRLIPRKPEPLEATH